MAAELAFAALLLVGTSLTIPYEHEKSRQARRAFAIAIKRNQAIAEVGEARSLTKHMVDLSLIGMAF